MFIDLLATGLVLFVVSVTCQAIAHQMDMVTWMMFIFITTDAVTEMSLWLSWAHCMVRAKWAGFALSVH